MQFRMRGFTLIELLVVLFIITTLALMAFPSLWNLTVKDDTIAIASTLSKLRTEAVSARKEMLFVVDFKDRQFRTGSAKAADKDSMKIVPMKDDETWELFIPSKGAMKEGEVIVSFTPSVQEEFIALYLSKDGKDTTIMLNNLSGEVEIEDGRRQFDE